MAKRQSSRKKKDLTFKQRVQLIIGVIVIFIAGVSVLLEKLGIVTSDTIMVQSGMKDKPAEYADTEVHFVDIGQGDATLVISDGEAMLIDSGDKDDKDTLVNYLESQGIEELKYVIVTHPHADHMGEMPDVLQNFTVDKFIMSQVPDDLVPTSYIYKKTLEEIKNQGLRITKATDTEFDLGDCTVELFTPKEEQSDLNNYSTFVKITDGENSFLITGDAEKSEEKDILSQGFDLSAKVLKVGHHGSRYSSTVDFLDEVLPRYAVISCGADNDYGHPHDEAVSRLNKYATNLYITAEQGTIVFYSDGEGLTVETERGDSDE
ncbi:MAG: ComEC/Rec2 family competence protein [Hominimerdicola sp.]